jgi:hypothetical protein
MSRDVEADAGLLRDKRAVNGDVIKETLSKGEALLTLCVENATRKLAAECSELVLLPAELGA